MKLLFTTLAIFLGFHVSAQTNTNEIFCDSVVMKDGTTEFVNIQRLKRNKIVYSLCCDRCAVPREFKMKDVDTIIHHPEKSKAYAEAQLDSIPRLVFTKMKKEKKEKGAREDAKVMVKTTDGYKYKGRLHILNADSIEVDNQSLALTDIKSISKPSIGAIIAGNALGSFFVIAGFQSASKHASNFLIPVGSGIGAVFYSANAIRRKFDLNKKWKVKVACKARKS